VKATQKATRGESWGRVAFETNCRIESGSARRNTNDKDESWFRNWVEAPLGH